MHRIGLNFHGIGKPKRALEQGEAPFWITEDSYLRILDRVADDSDRYVITFDDSNISDFEIGLPGLSERGLSAIFFVLSGRLEDAGSMGAEHLVEMQKRGMVVGSHGIDHVPWTSLGADVLETEIKSSKQRLEQICGNVVDLAGIPFGSYDARVLTALRKVGYRAAYTSDGGTMRPDGFIRARTSLRGDMDDDDIDRLLRGDMPALRRVRRHLGMLRRRLL